MGYSSSSMPDSYSPEGPSQASGKSTQITPVQPTTTLPKTLLAALRWVFSFPSMLILLVMGTAFAQARKGLADPDIWWHLRNAEYLLTAHRFIHSDMYSFTVAGHPWINTEWLSEIPFFLAWRAYGLMGIKLLSIAVIETIFLGLLYLCWKESGNIKASAVAAFWAVLLGAVTFGPRTILFGYLCLVILVILLQRFRSRGSAPLWVIPPLFCIWVNTHGSWSLGLIVFAIIVASGLVDGKWGKITSTRWSLPQLRKLLITFAASVVMLFINPYGYRLVIYPFDMAFHQKLNISHVAEWVSVDFHDLRGKVVLLLIVALLAGALLKSCKWKLYEVGLVLFGLYCGLTYIRFLMLAAILISPVMARLLDFIPPYRAEIDKPILNALIIFGALALMVHGRPSVSELEESINKDYPAEALSYLESHPPDGPVLNYYLWGGYLEWNDRTLKSFIDSRVDIFEYAGVLKDYLDLLGIKEPNAIFDKYRIQFVFFPPDTPLAYVLSHDPRWKVVYKGKMSEMFERVGSPNWSESKDATRVSQ